jgi:hypothetical protein
VGIADPTIRAAHHAHAAMSVWADMRAAYMKKNSELPPDARLPSVPEFLTLSVCPSATEGIKELYFSNKDEKTRFFIEMMNESEIDEDIVYYEKFYILPENWREAIKEAVFRYRDKQKNSAEK